jgi:hypothetical protein
MAFPGSRGWREQNEVERKEFLSEQYRPILELTEALLARNAAYLKQYGGTGLIRCWSEQGQDGRWAYSDTMSVDQGFALKQPYTFLKVESKMPIARINPTVLIDGSHPLQLFLNHRGRHDFIGIIGGPGWQEAIEYGAYGIQSTDDPRFTADLILEATKIERYYTNGSS